MVGLPVFVLLASCSCSCQLSFATAQVETLIAPRSSTADEVGLRTQLVSPENTAVLAGERTSFRCISNSSQALHWTSSPTGNPEYIYLVSGCMLNPQYAGAYELENVAYGRCDLVVLSATADLAMFYFCLETFGWDPAQSAQLVVLDANPECTINNTDPRINDKVTLTCNVSYTDNISPMQMFWTDEDGQPVASSISTTRGGSTTSSHTFLVTSFTLPQFTCTTNFSDPVNLTTNARNTPEYTYTWTSPPLAAKGELVTPLNIAAVVGDSVRLACLERSPRIVWNWTPVNASSSIAIAGDCTVVPAYANRYRTDTTHEACHLLIDCLSSAHAGTYICQDLMASKQPASSQLIVLETPPQCLIDADDVQPQDEVALSCSVSYSGNLAPVVTWTDETGAELEASTNTSRTRVESSVTVTAVDSSQLITATTHFEKPSEEPPSHVDPATNAPDYTHSWNTTLLPELNTEESVTEEHYTSPAAELETTEFGPIPDPEDCGDIKKYYPQAQSGNYSIFINGTDSVEVYCDMDTERGGWTVFQRRQDGSVGFYNTWVEYQAGFGELDGEFWLGNDNLAALTGQKQYVLRVDLGDWSSNRRFAQYTNFRVSGAADKYRLSSLGTYSGDAGDSLSSHLGMLFSTHDKDNDVRETGNCALSCRGAWWYYDCYRSSLNGVYNNTQNPQGIHWNTWLGSDYSLKVIEMKIRPLDF